MLKLLYLILSVKTVKVEKHLLHVLFISQLVTRAGSYKKLGHLSALHFAV